MSDPKVNSLKEALTAQQELLQKLYNELDVEREASSTAASEALSMILRLQGEKAAVKMEAEQYKRLAEEKMTYAEESMEIFEDLVYQKEMEISALDSQVQAFRHKLLCLGYDDPGDDDDLDYPDNMLNESDDETTSNVPNRNFTPLVPPPRLPFIRTGFNEKDKLESRDNDLILKDAEKQMGQVTNDQISALDKQSNIFSAGNINNYWEQIRKLDERVREITGEPNIRLSTSERPRDCIKGAITNGNDQLKHPDNLSQKEVRTNSSPVIVHDVFEVPETPEITSGEEHLKEIPSGDEHLKVEGKLDEGKLDDFHHLKEQGKLDEGKLDDFHHLKEQGKLDEGKLDDGKSALQYMGKGAKPNLISNEAFTQFLKHQADCFDKKLVPKHHEPKLCSPQDSAVDCHPKLVEPTTDSQCTDGIQQTSRVSEIAEIPAQPLRPESTLRLLNDMQKQLKSVQSELRRLKKSSSMDEFHMRTLREEMPHFWL